MRNERIKKDVLENKVSVCYSALANILRELDKNIIEISFFDRHLERELKRRQIMTRSSTRTYKLVLSAMLGAIVIVLGVTPLGFIPLGPMKLTILHIPVIIAAIYGGPYVGMGVGLVFGIMSVIQAPGDLTFGPVWATGEALNYFLIAINAIVPRILIGLTAALVYRGSKKIPRKTSIVILILIGAGMLAFAIYKLIEMINTGQAYYMHIVLITAIIGVGIWMGLTNKNKKLPVVLAAGIGTLTNTVLFLGLAYIFFGNIFAELFQISRKAVGDILATAGITNGVPELIVSIVLISAIVAGIKPENQINK